MVALPLLTAHDSSAPFPFTLEDYDYCADFAIWFDYRLRDLLHHQSRNVGSQATRLMADPGWAGDQWVGRRHCLASGHLERYVCLRWY